MKERFIILLLLGWASGLSLTACNEAACEADIPMSEPVSEGLVLRVGQGCMARTALGEDEHSTHEIRWTVGDRVAVWAQSVSAVDYLLEAEPFTFATYNAEFNSADFLADAPAMAEDTYDYHAVYPFPTERTGTQVTYTLPSAQSGQYDPRLDVMTATTTGNALLPRSGNQHAVAWREPELSFSHLFHLIRIRIPEGKNYLDLPIKMLKITFPQAVVGTVSFDVTNPEETAVWSNLSNEISVELPDDAVVDAGKGYIWLHVKPVDLQGEISFQAYNEAGVISDTISTVIDKTLTPQHITPIALTIPQSPFAPFTYINIREAGSNLGEDWHTMTVSGYQFLVPFSENTTSSVSFNRTSANSYKVAVCAAPSSMAGKSLPLRFESEHTLFDDALTIPASVATKGYNTVDKVIPYLLSEDFSGITTAFENGTVHKTSDMNEYSAISLAQYGLNDWYGARIGGAVGQNLRICSRVEMGMWVANRNTGRVDTPALSRLKPNANARIKVEYNYAGDRYEAVGSGGYPVYSAGTSSSVVTAGDDTIDNVVVSGVALTIDGPNKNGTYYGKTPHYKSFQAAGCSNTTRVSWFVTNNRASSFAGNGMYWLYIDNIRISIDNTAE